MYQGYSIGVAVITYNGQAYIEKQLDSIFRQTIVADQVVIFDDCSNDKTLVIRH